MEGQTRRPDRRVIKTKKAIRNAFVHLVSEKGISRITIKDIADSADINRKTFYNYYAGVHEIVDEIEDEIISRFVGALNDMDFVEAIQNPYTIFTRLTACINRDMDFYTHLFKKGSDSSLSSKVVSVLKVRIKEAVAQQVPIDPLKLEILADYAISGAMAVFQNWLASRQEVPLEEYSRMLGVLIIRGASGLLEPEA